MAVLAEAELVESVVADFYAKQGWKIIRQPPSADKGVDIIAEARGKKYLIEVKQAAEGRRDRLVPLLSQAILQVQAAARHCDKSVRPLAIVAARHIPNSVAEQVKQFAMKYAADVGIGIFDLGGLRVFHGYGLEQFNSERAAGARPVASWHGHSGPSLFSDLNQWMLKVLLASRIPESLLSAPRDQYKNGSHLAKAAGVSVMSASRFVRQLKDEGFLDERKGRLSLVRREELLQRWAGANVKRWRERPARWIIRKGKNQLLSAMESYILLQDAQRSRALHMHRQFPRICVGAFAAANLLGLGFVHGVGEHIYIDRLEPEALKRLGLSLECDENAPDIVVRIPDNSEAVFRAAVKHGAVPVSDVLQVWLDVSHQPERGKEQAELVWKRVLLPSLQKE